MEDNKLVYLTEMPEACRTLEHVLYKLRKSELATFVLGARTKNGQFTYAWFSQESYLFAKGIASFISDEIYRVIKEENVS